MDVGAVDFYSAQFDAGVALRTAGLQPPRAVRALTAFRDCRYLLPPSHPDYLSRRVEEQRRLERERERSFRVLEPVSPPKAPGLLEQLEQAAKGTIMACLSEWRAGRVLVHLRGPSNVKSTVECKLLAFDKHFNLLVTEAVETTVTKRQRRLASTIIKGDSVILVARIP